MTKPIEDLEHLLALNRWDRLAEYLAKTEEYLQKARADFEDWADEQIKKLTPTQKQEFYASYVGDFLCYQEEFPRILRNSFLVSAFSLLEHEMGIICRRLQRKKQIPISWNDLYGDMLTRAKFYCSRVGGLDITADNKTWGEIKYYSKVRNCIVHKSGLLKDFQDDQDLITYIKRKGIISQDSIEQEVALTNEFCEELFNTIHTFLKKLRIAIGEL